MPFKASGQPTTAVNSGLRRARTQLARAMPAEDELAEPDDAVQRAVLERFAAAIERADAGAMAGLLRADAVLEMPPFLTWFADRDAVAGFVGSRPGTAARPRPAPATNSSLPRPQAVPRRFRGVRLVCIYRAPQRTAQNRKAE